MDRQITRFFNINFLFLAANFLLVLCFFCKLEKIDIGNYFNSDSLYLPSVYKDLFVDKSGLQGWHFNPAPNFFPDMLFYFIFLFLTGNNFIVVSFIFSLTQYFFILYLIVKIFKVVVPNQPPKFHSVIYLLLSLWFLEFFYHRGHFIFAYILLSNAYHTGQFVVTLGCMVITVKLFTEPAKWRLSLLFILVFLAVFSDKLFILTFVIPLIFTSVFFIAKHYKKLVTIIPLSILATILSVCLYNYVGGQGYIFFEEPKSFMNREGILNAYHIFSELLMEFVMNFGYSTLSMYLFFLSIALLVVVLVKVRRSSELTVKFFVVFIICQSVSVIFGTILTGNFFGFDCFRYNIYPLYLTGLNFSVFLSLCIKKTNLVKSGFNMGMSVVVIALLLSTIKPFNYQSLLNFFRYYPEVSKRLDEVAEKEGLMNGVGNYWVAKKASLFSKKGIRVRAMFDDMIAYDHVTNENWFFNQNNKFNFVLLNRVNDTISYKKRPLDFKRLYNEPEFKLVKTSVFVYDRSYAPKEADPGK